MPNQPINPRALAIAGGCFLKGWATLEFPDSNRAHPAMYVYVFPTTTTPRSIPLLADSFAFPLLARWDVWQGVMVPTLLAYTVDSGQSFSQMVDNLDAEITGRLREAGLIL